MFDGFMLTLCSNTVDDEEEMLYGDSNASTSTAKEDLIRGGGTAGSGSEGSSSKAEPSHWCMITRENGVMEVTGLARTEKYKHVYINLNHSGLFLLTLLIFTLYNRFTSCLTGAWCSW